ncbi:MAG: Na(+)/H(+)-K(+) antiporter GerN [Bryobacteraceae bacterium]|nr:Na(+)/H(+)-K(+) antiporter GerN [Bryobacteraceae bacterium]
MILETPPIGLLLASSGETGKLLFTMLLVFGSAKVLYEVFEALRQPGIIGEILAGVVLGPGVLNLLQPTDFLGALAELGAMFLLFRVGLEVRSSDLLETGKTALLVAVLGVIIPFAMGFAISGFWHGSPVEALFLGAAMVATSVGITAQVLSSKGLLNHLSSKTILAAAVIDDVLGLILLAVVSSLAKGEVRLMDLLLTAGMAIGFTAAVVWWGSKTVARVVPIVQETLKGDNSEFKIAMVLLLGMGLLALEAGVAAIIGAFLAGMALSTSVSHRVHDLTSGLSEFLVPFFLVGIGLNFNLKAFAEPEVLLMAGIVLVAAVVSKLVGCGLGAWRLGRRNMFRVGAGMVPRGEVGMVVAQLGMTLGVVPDTVYAIVVTMSLLTTMVAPPLLNIAFRGESEG